MPVSDRYSFRPGNIESRRFELELRYDRVVPRQMDVNSRFGRRLRKLRLEHDMTQSEMAKRFGIDRSFISDVERGRKSISLHMLEVIAIGMGISLSKLFEDI